MFLVLLTPVLILWVNKKLIIRERENALCNDGDGIEFLEKNTCARLPRHFRVCLDTCASARTLARLPGHLGVCPDTCASAPTLERHHHKDIKKLR